MRMQPPADPDAREAAYRANNVGVALLEQFNYTAAADRFREALRLNPPLALARVNLAIALLYAPDLDGAEREATDAARLLPNDPHPSYILGLIERARGGRDAQARAAFDRVLQLDPRDVGAQINLGQIDLQEQRYTQAVDHFRAALTGEPSSVTAMYNLGLALTRAGRRDEGVQAMERSQAMRAGGYGIIFSANYLEQGRYAEALVSTGAERDLVDRARPDVTFARQPIASGGGESAPTSVALLDVDGDGHPGIVAVWSGGIRVLRNDGRSFSDITAQSGIEQTDVAGAVAAVAGDYDNDGRADLLILRRDGTRLFHNDGGGKFSNATTAAKLPTFASAPESAAFVDFDHDGDLDLVIAGTEAVQLVRNNGNGTFTDITADTGIAAAAGGIAVLPTDYDNHRDIDLMIVRSSGRPALYKNLRDGTFRDVATETGLDVDGRVTTAATADVNKDDFPDFFFGRRGSPGVFALSDGRGRFSIAAAPPETVDATASQLLDYDNDGLIDLVTWSAGGPHLFRNVGDGWIDVTEGTMPAGAGGSRTVVASPRSVAAADFGAKGTSDLVVADRSGAVSWWRSSTSHPHPSIAVHLTGRASNRAGVGSKIDLRAGSLRARIETSSATPQVGPADVVFGLGSRPGADVIRVLWPSGILQAETTIATPLAITELDRKPSSCPFLYTWNGHRFEFVTDFMGGGEMGYWEAPSVRNSPDPEEYVRIRGDQLQPRAGRYELRVTNELEEAVFYDRFQLLAIAHPGDVDIYPNEGMTDPPKPFRLFAARDAKPPARVVDDRGRDVTARIARRDRLYADGFPLARFRGYAEPHALTLTVPPSTAPELLLLTGWTDYAFSSDNVAAHQAGLALQPPRVERRDRDGRWRTLVDDIGIPVGRPQTIVVDIGRASPSSDGRAAELRIVTNMRIYWDQILVATAASLDGVTIDRLDPTAARLAFRGFSAEVRPDGRDPVSYDYARVTADAGWKVMRGDYTREGDVLPLLTAADDRFAIARPGDEVALAFDASHIAALRAVQRRTFLLFADGFSKEMDVNSASPDEVGPLPFHGMSRYPYAWPERYPDTAATRQYQSEYNTRHVSSPLPSLELIQRRHD